MALDPEIDFRHEHYTTEAAKDLVPSVPPKVKARHGDSPKKSSRGGSKILYQEFTSQSSQAERPTQRRPRSYRFVHSDGRVDVVTDLTSGRSNRQRDPKAKGRSRRQTSDTDEYLTPSETEPDDPGMMSKSPVSKQQIKGLRRNEKARQMRVGENSTARLPIYYSTNRKQKNAELTKECDERNKELVSRQIKSSHNQSCNRKGGSFDDSSYSDSDESSDAGNKSCYRRDVRHRTKKEGKKGDRSSSKENLSDDGEDTYETKRDRKRSDRNRERKPYGRNHRSYSQRDVTRSHGSKGYMKPDKYDGSSCFETFLTQFNNCADFNRWTESEKLSYLR